jgi:hypothetical protein
MSKPSWIIEWNSFGLQPLIATTPIAPNVDIQAEWQKAVRMESATPGS